jgi:hypothetical protein
MGRAVLHNRLNLLAREIAGVEHFHVSAIGAELWIEFVAGDRHVEGFLGARDGRQTGASFIAQSGTLDRKLDVVGDSPTPGARAQT